MGSLYYGDHGDVVLVSGVQYEDFALLPSSKNTILMIEH